MKLLGPFFSPDIMKKYQAKENKQAGLWHLQWRTGINTVSYFRWQT
jgi:hypothetical protein